MVVSVGVKDGYMKQTLEPTDTNRDEHVKIREKKNIDRRVFM